MKRLLVPTVLLSLAACDPVGERVPENRTPTLNCHAGAYRLDDGRIIDVLMLDGDQLRWRSENGQTGVLTPTGESRYASTLGWTRRPDGNDVDFGPCAEERIDFAGIRGRKVPFVEKEIHFKSGNETLFGRLILPEGHEKVPVAVWVHGSEGTAATIFAQRRTMFPALGIGTFVYDKRGTGHSTGTYTQDFDVLANDAVAAAEAARELAGDRLGRLGFDGGSQGGWVAPLAATRTKVDFVIASYGLAEGPLAEDREQVQYDLKDRGFEGAVLSKAREITDATGEVMRSHFRAGFEALDRVRDKYEEEAWYPFVKGEFTGEFLKTPNVLLYLFGPRSDVGTSWDYEPMATLSKLDTPMLWVLAGSDREAPPDETRKRIKGLVEAGRPIVFAEFPDTDHGIVEFETDAEGRRIRLRQAEGYLRMITDFARDGHVKAEPYGRAIVKRGPGSP